MDFRILGSLEVWEGERQLDLGGSKRRAVLAFLLLHANEVVGVDRLIDQLWGEKAPRNAAAALHTHVSRLRKELGADLVATRAWGYVLRIEPGAIDLERFERLVADAENLPARERAEKLRDALALWRGRPLEDLMFQPALAKDIARLEELRLAVLENRIDADLEAGNHNGIIGELETLIVENPLRERLRGQLILALYRSARQAEALEVYRETRRLLADELGLDPSPELRELERAILQQDPALAAPPLSTGSTAEFGPRPGRRRRLYVYGGAVAVVLLGAIAAVAALVGTRGTHVAQRSSPPAVRTTATTRASAGGKRRTTTHLHAQAAMRRIPRGGKRATVGGRRAMHRAPNRRSLNTSDQRGGRRRQRRQRPQPQASRNRNRRPRRTGRSRFESLMTSAIRRLTPRSGPHGSTAAARLPTRAAANLSSRSLPTRRSRVASIASGSMPGQGASSPALSTPVWTIHSCAGPRGTAQPYRS